MIIQCCCMKQTDMSVYLPCSYSLAGMLQHKYSENSAPCGAGAPSPFPLFPLSIYFSHLFYFSLSFSGFTYFLLLSIPYLSTRIVPLRFQAGGRRRRPNLGLVCVLFCTLCYLYSLVKMYCGALFYLVLFCAFLQCFDTVGWVI